MIGRIRGKLLEKQSPMVLVEACGLGYEIWVPMTSIYRLGEIGEEVILHTHFVVREDVQQLYGFALKSDRRLFQELIKVNGIGAKMALAILSGMDGETFIHCIESKDYGLLCTIPGVGKKTAERMVIEMKDKVEKLSLELDALVITSQENESQGSERNAEQKGVASQYHVRSIARQAVEALEALGYKQKEAEKHVGKIKERVDTVEMMIKKALQLAQK